MFATTLALLVAGIWPRAGQMVALVLPVGASPLGALAAPDWRVRSISEVGPITLILAVPETPQADPGRLRRSAGAFLVTLAAPRSSCSEL